MNFLKFLKIEKDLVKINFNNTPDFFKNKFKKKLDHLNDDFIKFHASQIIEDGYTIIKNDVNHEIIDKCLLSFYDWKDRNINLFDDRFFKYEKKLDRIINLHTTLSDLNLLFLESKSNKVLDYLFQSETSLYTSLFFEVGSTQEPHIDIPLFWTNPPYLYFGTWLALEDIDNSNGPLVVFPGSQKIKLYNPEKVANSINKNIETISGIDEELWNTYQKEVLKECINSKIKKVEVIVNKGDRIIWHPLLLHGGKQIEDFSRTRLSFVNHVTPYKTPVYHMDVFFNKNKLVKRFAPWNYLKKGDRYIADFSLQLNHVENYDYTKLK